VAVISLEPAIRLFHHRWSVPIVAVLYRDGPMPFGSLAGALPASRDTITETLVKLEANGVIVREHAERRARYALTPLGLDVGSACVPLLKLVGETDLRAVGLKKWPLLVAVALGRGAERYNEAKAALPGITARALALALKDLESVGLVNRTVEHGYPPSPNYQLTQRGRDLFPALNALCVACELALEAHESAPET
jgi:DNA-binding HxlR family transcriptional regulator